MPIDALSVLCAQLTRDLLAIAKFFFISSIDGTTNGQTRIVWHPKTVKSIRLLAVPEQVKNTYENTIKENSKLTYFNIQSHIQSQTSSQLFTVFS